MCQDPIRSGATDWKSPRGGRSYRKTTKYAEVQYSTSSGGVMNRGQNQNMDREQRIFLKSLAHKTFTIKCTQANPRRKDINGKSINSPVKIQFGVWYDPHETNYDGKDHPDFNQ